MALALVHHLAIGRNVPLPMLAATLARLGDRLLIEWVPKEDPMVRRLLATREDIFPDYTEGGFRTAFEQDWTVAATRPVEGTLRDDVPAPPPDMRRQGRIALRGI